MSFLTRSSFNFNAWLEELRGKLIVSCQALPGEPLYGSEIMAKMALAAQLGGAVGIRANSPPDIRAIRDATSLPILGLYKESILSWEVYITPTIAHARQVADAGADIISIDATLRPHPDGLPLDELIGRIKTETGCPVLADISTLAEAIQAERCGADMVATTLSGYTPYSPQLEGPDLQLVADVARTINIPCLAEGRYASPDQTVEAIRLGAYAVVVGGAITRPAEITARFVRTMDAYTHSVSS